MNIVPIIMPMNTTRTVDCITSSGKTYCEKSDVPKDVIGMVIILTTIWAVILFWIMNKWFEDEWSGWIAGGYVFVTVILLGLLMIFI